MHPTPHAAERWIELGNYDEAAEERLNCTPAVKSSIERVKAWATIYHAKQRRTEGEMMCETLAKHATDYPFTVSQQGEAFHKQGQSREALVVLKYAPVRLKHGSDFYYLMARVLCGVEQFTLALTCVGKAVDADPRIRMKALKDPELELV